MLIRAGSTPVTRTKKDNPKPLAWGYLFSSENHGRKPLKGASPRVFARFTLITAKLSAKTVRLPQSSTTELPAPNTINPSRRLGFIVFISNPKDQSEGLACNHPKVYVICRYATVWHYVSACISFSDHLKLNSMIVFKIPPPKIEKAVVPTIQIISDRRRRTPFL